MSWHYYCWALGTAGSGTYDPTLRWQLLNWSHIRCGGAWTIFNLMTRALLDNFDILMTRAEQSRFQGLFVTSCLVRWYSTLWTLAPRSSEAIHKSRSGYCFHPLLRQCNNVDWVWSLLSQLWSPRDCGQYRVQLCSWQGGWTFSILVGGNQKTIWKEGSIIATAIIIKSIK